MALIVKTFYREEQSPACSSLPPSYPSSSSMSHLFLVLPGFCVRAEHRSRGTGWTILLFMLSTLWFLQLIPSRYSVLHKIVYWCFSHGMSCHKLWFDCTWVFSIARVVNAIKKKHLFLTVECLPLFELMSPWKMFSVPPLCKSFLFYSSCKHVRR